MICWAPIAIFHLHGISTFKTSLSPRFSFHMSLPEFDNLIGTPGIPSNDKETPGSLASPEEPSLRTTHSTNEKFLLHPFDVKPDCPRA